MVADTCYWKLINIYRHHVDATQMHVVFTEDLKRAPEICLRSCFDFLGADTRVHLSEVSRQRNSRDEKYMDGQLLHWIRTTPSVARWWNCLSVRKQTWLMRILRLRSKMNGPIHWSEAAKEIFREQLLDDARLFLSHYGKPESFWDFSSIIDNEPAFKVAS
jgi:hypothetical protein